MALAGDGAAVRFDPHTQNAHALQFKAMRQRQVDVFECAVQIPEWIQGAYFGIGL